MLKLKSNLNTGSITMKKYLLGLTTATILFSPLLYADTPADGSVSQQPITAAPAQPESTDKTDLDTSAVPTTSTSMPESPSTTATPSTSQDVGSTDTANDSMLTDIQLKTTSGSIIPAKIDSKDLQGINVGESLEITGIGTNSTTAQ